MTEMIAGGYILIRPEPMSEYLTANNLLPKALLSASHCISNLSGIAEWAGGNPEALGVPKDKVESANQWGESAHNDLFGYPNIFYTLQNAQDYVDQFIPDIPDDLTILGIALSRTNVEKLINLDVAKYGVYQMLERMKQPTEGGIPLGYEILSFGYGIEHTWLCYSFHEKAYEQHDIKPNQHGFLNSELEAQLIIDSIVRIPPNTKDEPWYPFQMIQYEVKPN